MANSQWTDILSKDDLEARYAATAKLDARFAKSQREFYESRTPSELRVLASQAWCANDADGYQLARSYTVLAGL